MHVQLVDILLPQILPDGFIGVILLELSHLYICFGAPDHRIRDDWNISVREGGQGFSHDSWLAAVTVRFSKISLQFLHCPGKIVG